MMRVLVTGASGFVGRTLCDVLIRHGYTVRAASRRGSSQTSAGEAGAAVEPCVAGEINGQTDWSAALVDVDHVIHLAARVHVLHDVADKSPLYAETNAEGTRKLAESAARAGVRRFLYVSSIKVNGEETAGRPYTASDSPRPVDAYGASKWLGEQYLTGIAAQSSLKVAIVRPPLVYGPGVRANFLRLMGWVAKGWPLPLGAVDNRRSLVNVWNLCDLLLRLLTHPEAADRTWLVSDGEDLSTAELIRRIAKAMQRRAILIPVPVGPMYMLASLAGRRAEMARLCGSLVVDSSATCRDLGWAPPVGVDEALCRTAAWYGVHRGS
jgi:nucleoside-diphosphate-sugar epimerase